MKKKALKQDPAGPVWTFFCSVRLTVVVLLALAFTSIIGTLIPQNGGDVFYLQKYGQGWSKVFMALDIDDMYHSWWFLTLLAMLAVNIVVCSIQRLRVTWKIIFPKKIVFRPDRFRRLKDRETFAASVDNGEIVDRFQGFLKRRVGKVTRQTLEGSTVLFAEKGRWTRIGVYVVHSSILLLLVGSVIGGVWGFKGRVSIPEGDTTDVIELRQGVHEHLTLDFAIRCNTFDVSFYDTGAPNEFKSNVTLIENGVEVLTTDIVVNHPLRYKGISFYQSNYGIAAAKSISLTMTSKESGLAFQQDIEFNKAITLPENQGSFVMEHFVKGYNFQGHNLGESFVGKVTAPDGTESEIVIPVKFPTFDKMRRGTFAFAVDHFEKLYYTGLQVNRDPGVWFVYSGFILMIIGCWITFFMSHQSYCVEIKDLGKNKVMVDVSATSNRNPQSLKLKTAKLALAMKELKS
ncbi:ResB [Desulforapulum autotrophicum HRM2]|uniref:ResB n=1 Tax=Desulforapulum autotrophicum (strain ATCC 43914 / DSM 3382 / VKM B-1955 / HRM2) TaxID=177437 RepID=C0QBY0_DESAH|nr:cytochrome c biogenesis protein ResB [Desulforapulum autotrophicum]ACN14992.1 ResB [Desulforapulum autotrophicum HRM2]